MSDWITFGAFIGSNLRIKAIDRKRVKDFGRPLGMRYLLLVLYPFSDLRPFESQSN